MEALKFDLYSKSAFIKNPENNIGTEFSFEHIHKPMLLGILGCILGLKGISSITKNNPFPEYYTVLKDIQISIVPHKPVFQKYIEKNTNTTGFANRGNTQILTREMLQNPRWTIYILKDSIKEEYYTKLKTMLSKHESIYPLYLGNNSCMAKVDNVEEVKVEGIKDTEEITINSIFSKDIVEKKYEYVEADNEVPYDLNVYIPIDNNELLLYNYEWQEYTNLIVDVKAMDNLYSYGDKILYFL